MTPLSFRPFFWEIRPLSIILATTGIGYLTSGWWWGHCSRNNVCSQPLIHSNILSKSHRDHPDSLPSFVGENEAKKGYIITQMGDNVFAAVLWVFPCVRVCFFIINVLIVVECIFVLCCITFKISFSLHLSKRKKEKDVKKAGAETLEKLEGQLRERAGALGLSLDQKSKAMKQRDRKVPIGKVFTS